MERRRLPFLLLFLLILTACAPGGGTGSAPAPSQTPATPPQSGAAPPPPPAQPGTAASAGTPTPAPARTPDRPTIPSRPEPAAEGTAAALMPAQDWEATFSVWELGPRQISRPRERLLREGDRVVAVQEGKPYATWLIDATGLWRADPRSGGALLRYLPHSLKDGETWKQVSGGAEVWFRLTRGADRCQGAQTHWVESERCWTLTVLNRGEESTFRFGPEFGPFAVRSTDWTNPAASFVKIRTYSSAQRLPVDQRAELLAQAPPATAPRAEVIPVSPDQFQAKQDELRAQLGSGHDLDGDGAADRISVPPDTWTREEIEIRRADGTLLETLKTYQGAEQKVSLVRFPPAARSFLLRQTRGGTDPGSMTILEFQERYDGLGFTSSYGWDRKAQETPASSVLISDEGLITVEWEFGDPAGHTRVRQFRFHAGADPGYPSQLSESIRPAGKELIYPAEPVGVLRAAFFARWFGLDEELPRYFDRPETARSMPKLSRPDYGPGGVSFATATITRGKPPACLAETKPAALGPDGKAPWAAWWGGYEWGEQAWGTVTFGKNGEGRWVITAIAQDGTCHGTV